MSMESVAGRGGGRSVAAVGVVSWVLRSLGQRLRGSAGGGNGRDSGERGGDLVGPGPAAGDAKPAAAFGPFPIL